MAITSIAPQVLQTSGACTRDDKRPSTGAWIPTGVVTADLWATLHGTGAPFAACTLPTPAPYVAMPRPYTQSVSGITSSGPPV